MVQVLCTHHITLVGERDVDGIEIPISQGWSAKLATAEDTFQITMAAYLNTTQCWNKTRAAHATTMSSTLEVSKREFGPPTQGGLVVDRFASASASDASALR